MDAATVIAGSSAAATAAMLAAMLASRARAARAERECAERIAELERERRAGTLKDEFVSTVSHELRTPLTSIRGALGLLSAGQCGPMSEKAQNLVRIASTNSDRLVRLINDILDLERMDAESAPLAVSPCAMRTLLAQAIDAMLPLAEEAGVRLQVDAESAGEHTVFEGDADRMLQVLCNLLSNAIKFSPAGAAVRVHLQTDAESFRLRMEDEGRGVPADKLESIFRRFQQVEPEDARRKGGTGLGLAICKAIVEQHGGAIRAERNDATRPGAAGTTFEVWLPRYAPEAVAPAVAMAARRAA